MSRPWSTFPVQLFRSAWPLDSLNQVNIAVKNQEGSDRCFAVASHNMLTHTYDAHELRNEMGFGETGCPVFSKTTLQLQTVE